MGSDLLPIGTQVEFVFASIDDGETVVTYTGVILDHIPAEGDFKGGYRIACQYVVAPEDVHPIVNTSNLKGHIS